MPFTGFRPSSFLPSRLPGDTLDRFFSLSAALYASTAVRSRSALSAARSAARAFFFCTASASASFPTAHGRHRIAQSRVGGGRNCLPSGERLRKADVRSASSCAASFSAIAALTAITACLSFSL